MVSMLHWEFSVLEGADSAHDDLLCGRCHFPRAPERCGTGPSWMEYLEISFHPALASMPPHADFSIPTRSTGQTLQQANHFRDWQDGRIALEHLPSL